MRTIGNPLILSNEFRRVFILKLPVSVWRDGRLIDRGTIVRYDWDVVTLQSHLDGERGHFTRTDFMFLEE